MISHIKPYKCANSCHTGIKVVKEKKLSVSKKKKKKAFWQLMASKSFMLPKKAELKGTNQTSYHKLR